MFYKKTIKTLFNELMKTKHYFNDEENLIIEKINDTEKHVSQLEKRINNIADYIQGPYTEQINNQIKALASAYSKLEVYTKHTNKKTTVKTTKKKGK